MLLLSSYLRVLFPRIARWLLASSYLRVLARCLPPISFLLSPCPPPPPFLLLTRLYFALDLIALDSTSLPLPSLYLSPLT